MIREKVEKGKRGKGLGWRVQIALKRLFDIVVSLTALTLLSPLMALIALAIKLDDGGPIFYAQDRVGKDGKIFRCYKFRSMVINAEKIGLGLEVAKDDPRITRVGKVLRHWRLDEIPQCLNVLKGDMSVVGPRATIPSHVARYTPHQRRRLEMKPGMAGWAFVNGNNAIPWDQRIELDIWYIDHWSLWLDLVILLKAVGVVLRREGLYDAEGMVRDLRG
ncbi:MAG TPA: sugar transferase [Anaerolineae bacterium]|nr:sugar transferase [Anaerolineae bacterium]